MNQDITKSYQKNETIMDFYYKIGHSSGNVTLKMTDKLDLFVTGETKKYDLVLYRACEHCNIENLGHRIR